MKVRVCYTVECTDRYRRAVNNFHGLPGLATKKDLQQWLEMNGGSCDDDIMFQLDQDEPEEPEEST